MIKMALEGSSAFKPIHATTLQKTFEEAILNFLYGPPTQEEKALKKIKEILDFALKYGNLGDQGSNN